MTDSLSNFFSLAFQWATLLWNQSWNFNIRYSGKSILWWTDRVKSLTLPSISLDTSVIYNSIDKFRPVLQHVEILRVQVVQWNDKLSFAKFRNSIQSVTLSRRTPIFTDIKQAFLENIARLSLHEMVSEKL